MEKEEIKEALAEVLDEKMTEFWVDRETHYQHHQFLGGIIKWSATMKSTIWGTIARAIVLGLIGILLLGFILWGRNNLK